jgi:hypothetical protein
MPPEPRTREGPAVEFPLCPRTKEVTFLLSEVSGWPSISASSASICLQLCSWRFLAYLGSTGMFRCRAGKSVMNEQICPSA